MTTARTSRTRYATVLVAALSMLLTMAAPAIAANVQVQGRAACVDGDTLNYTVTLVDRVDETDRLTADVSFAADGVTFSPIGTVTIEKPTTSASGSADIAGLADATDAKLRVRVTDSDNPKVKGDVHESSVNVDGCGDSSSPGPSATFTACGVDAPAALLKNPTDADVDFRVRASTAGASDFDQTVTVAPGRSKRVVLQFAGVNNLEDRTISLRVDALGSNLLNQSFTVDCENDPEPENPTADIDGECTSQGGAVSVSVDNPTGAAVTYVVTVDGAEVDRFAVTSGSETRDYAVGDGSYDVVVTADGATVASETVEIDCEAAPSATAVGGCLETGVIEVELTNTAPSAATFVVSIDGVVVDTVAVTDGIESIVFPAAEGARDVVITADGVVVLDTTVDVICSSEVIAVSFEVGCDATTGIGSFLAQISNDGPATSAQVLVDGELVADVDVAANTITEFAVELPSGLSEVVVVSDGVTIFEAPIEVDCVQSETDSQDPDVIVTHECQTPAGGVYDVTVENPGVDPTDLTITMTDGDGVPVVDEALTLTGGESATIATPLANGTYVLTVTVDGDEVVNESVDVDCTEVLGITDRPDEDPAILPAAGAATVAWVLLALLLMFFGADVLLSGELRRRLAMMRA